jgi:tryptophanase
VANVAVTLAVPVIVKVVGLAVVLEKLPPLPLHPENVYPAGVFAVRLIPVLGVYPPVQF